MAGELLMAADSVSKKFCRSLKRSLWYGVQDMVHEANPFARPELKDGRLSELRRDEFWAVDHVSFELRRGECLGLIGRNGAGKTTLLKVLNGLIRPDAGRVEIRGRVGALIALGAGFNPILTGRENIYVNGSVLGLSNREINDKVDEIIDFAEIGDFIDTPVQNYSSGMQVRLGFAIATALEPDVLLLDEVLAVGDHAFRTKCFQRIGKVLERAAVIFVSHDAVQVSRICDRCVYLKAGKQIAIGQTSAVQQRYEEDNPDPVGVISIAKGDSVTRFECTSPRPQIKWGEILEIDIVLEFSEPNRSGLALIALLSPESTVAQVEITSELNAGLNRGPHVRLGLGPMYLREGTYFLSVTIWNESRKGTLVHAFNLLSVQVSGPKGYGVPYQMQVQAR